VLTEENKTLILSYIKSETSSLNTSDRKSIDSLVNMIDWSASKTRTTGNTSFAYLPTKDNTDHLSLSVWINTSKHNVDSCNISVINPKLNGSTLDEFEQTFKSLKKEVVQNVASITEYSLSKTFKYEYGFKNNSYDYSKFIQVKGGNSSSQIKVNEQVCTDWYLVTTHANGTQDWVFLYQTCTDDCRQTYIGDLKTGTNIIKSMGCRGGGGGQTQADPACVNEQINNFSLEENNSFPSAQSVGFDIGEINSFTKYKNPKWKCFTGYGGWTLISQETGIVKLDDPQTNQWSWVSLSHSGITMEGSPTPGVAISFSQGFGTPSFTPETASSSTVLYAGMTLDYSVTYTFVCNCGGITSAIVPPKTKNYTSQYGFWNAKP
jgi:hypothetical protein